MVSISGRPRLAGNALYPLSGSINIHTVVPGTASIIGGGLSPLRVLGLRRMSKVRFWALVLMFVALGCIIPYYTMKHAEEEIALQEELLVQERLTQDQESPSMQTQGQFNQGTSQEKSSTSTNAEEPDSRKYKRRAFFEDVAFSSLVQANQQQHRSPSHLRLQRPLGPPNEIPHGEPWQDPRLGPNTPLRNREKGSHPVPSEHASSIPLQRPSLSANPDKQQLSLTRKKQRDILKLVNKRVKSLRRQASFQRVHTTQDYEEIVLAPALHATREYLLKRFSEEGLVRDKIPGTGIVTFAATQRFRELMDRALNQGRWVYEPDRDYPDFGGATGWNKKKQNERDRDVAIDRAPFPEAGKYHWEPSPLATQDDMFETMGREYSRLSKAHGWYANRLQPDEFCRLLGPRHIVLVGDMIHWQLHDSIMYNMFDNPQSCYGDLACHLGVGHPLCPLPHDVRLKFVRNDVLSPVRTQASRMNETKKQDPVEMSWLRDMKLKDTIILGATHFMGIKDSQFQRRLVDTVVKIRKVHPDALIIYRNNPVGHPECPCKQNGFNVERNKVREMDPVRKGGKSHSSPLRDTMTIGAPARPFEKDIPVLELMTYPLNWGHYDRQNRMAKEIIEAVGGIYWNVATMTNMRPDGHVGGQDCLGYRRPGPTDEWAVSLFNLFKTIEVVEQEFGLETD
ncbi:hypothetical protein BGW38_001276 [Lunasporangiospora selenospora]|uniref:Uncharacterized protein n=1 Tax=Lunasporangiospora selenospora TaxID=979761 RepID=A0A9P6FVU0_9FUNG|nr:hypothetical protein BGW38_001276 [Lunasporangiospora selenospora]